MAVTLPHKMPHIVIDSLVEEGNYLSSTLPISFDNSQRIDLEGDFHEFFALYTPNSYGVEALSLIAPDVMETLMQFASVCDIEIIDHTMYFYWPDVFVSPRSWSNKFAAVEAVLQKVGRKIQNKALIARAAKADNGTIASKAKNPTRLKQTSYKNYLATGVILYILWRIAELLLPDIGYMFDVILLAVILLGVYRFYKKSSAQQKLLQRNHEISQDKTS